MERSQMREANYDRDEMLARAAIMAARIDHRDCTANRKQMSDYRSLVAEINSLTDSDMELALLAR